MTILSPDQARECIDENTKKGLALLPKKLHVTTFYVSPFDELTHDNATVPDYVRLVVFNDHHTIINPATLVSYPPEDIAPLAPFVPELFRLAVLNARLADYIKSITPNTK